MTSSGKSGEAYYKAINNKLRRGEKLDADEEEIHQGMLWRLRPVGQEMRVYRGVRERHLADEEISVGQIFDDTPTWNSSSTDPSTAAGFGKAGGRVWDIRLLAEAPGIITNAQQREVILPMDIKLKVLRIDTLDPEDSANQYGIAERVIAELVLSYGIS